MKRFSIALFLIALGSLFIPIVGDSTNTQMPISESDKVIKNIVEQKEQVDVNVNIIEPSDGKILQLRKHNVPLVFDVVSLTDLREINVEVLGEGQELFFNICSPENEPCISEHVTGSIKFSCPIFEGENLLKVIAIGKDGKKTEASSVIQANFPSIGFAPIDLGPIIGTPPLPDPESRSTWDLLILTHGRPSNEDFVTALQPLVHHKNSTGMPTILLTLDSIGKSCKKLNTNEGICGNDKFMNGIYEIPEFRGWDHPEIIKKAIEYAKSKWAIKYVMLVGDSDRFPIRYIKIYDLGHHGNRFEPSDLYYADLYLSDGKTFDAWDYDGDHIYGESQANFPNSQDDLNQDRIDLTPDVAVGRIPVSNRRELVTYVQKVISYEKNTTNAAWFKRALLIAGDFGDSIGENNSIGNMLSKQNFDLNKQYYDQIPLGQRMTNIKEALDKGVGFVNFIGHGSGAKEGKNGGLWASGWYDYSRIPCLGNNDRLPIVFSAACETAIFHFGQFGPYFAKQGFVYDDNIIDPHYYRWAPEPISLSPETYDRDSLAEHFLVKGSQGAIAFIGSYGGVQISGKLAKYFFQAYTSGIHVLGDVWNKAIDEFKINYIDNNLKLPGGSWFEFAKTRHIHKMLLFGDPSLRIGGLLPDLIPKPNANGNFCREENGKLLVTVANQGDATAGVFTTLVEFSHTGGPTATTKTLAAGESVDLFFRLDQKKSNKPIRIKVDNGLDVTESNEENNIADIVCLY